MVARPGAVLSPYASLPASHICTHVTVGSGFRLILAVSDTSCFSGDWRVVHGSHCRMFSLVGRNCERGRSEEDTAFGALDDIAEGGDAKIAGSEGSEGGEYVLACPHMFATPPL